MITMSVEEGNALVKALDELWERRARSLEDEASSDVEYSDEDQALIDLYHRLTAKY